MNTNKFQFLAIKTFVISDELQCLLLVMINVGEAVFSSTLEVNLKNGVSIEE